MAKVTLPLRYRVDYIEYERGWGSRLDETEYYDNEEEARRVAKEYNEKYNTAPSAPDWYIVAQYVGKVT